MAMATLQAEASRSASTPELKTMNPSQFSTFSRQKRAGIKKNNKFAQYAGIFLSMLSFTSAAKALPYVKGNVFVSTGSGTVIEYTPTGTVVQTLTGGSSLMTGSAFDASGNFYVTNFSANTVRKYDSNGTSPGSLFGSGYSTPEMIVCYWHPKI